MSINPKLVSILSLFQVVFIVAGFGVTRFFLHIHDQIASAQGLFTHPASGLTGFIGTFGLWFLLAPLIWSCMAAARGEAYRRIVAVPFRQFMIGIGLTVSIAVMFCWAGFDAFETLC